MLKDALLNRERPSKRFYQYFIYYIILLILIVFIISCVVYKYFISVFKKEIMASNQSALNKAIETMDMRIMEMNNLAVMISKNKVIYDSSIIGDGYNRKIITSELSKCLSSNMFIHEILLYYKDRGNGHVYTSRGSHKVDDVFEYIYNYEDWKKDDFLGLLDDSKNIPFMRPVEKVIYSRADSINFATYIFPLPLSSYKPDSIAAFLIKASMLKDILRDVLKDYDGYVYILNEQMEPLFYQACGFVEKEPLYILSELNNLDKSGTESINIDGLEFSVSKSVSNYSRWTYISIMKSNQLYLKVSNIKRIFETTIIFVTVLGIIVALVFSSKQYKMLKLLANIVKRKITQFSDSNINYGDEVKIISHGIEHISNENNILNAQLRDNLKKVRDEIALSLLKGEYKDKQAERKAFEMLGLNIGEGYSIVVLAFLIDNYEEYSSREDSCTEKLLKFSIVNVLEELSKNLGYGYGVDLQQSGKIALILCLKPSLCSEYTIDRLINETREIFIKHYHIGFTVGIGNIYKSINMIKSTFSEALIASNYRLIYGRAKNIYFKGINLETTSLIGYSSEHEDELMDFIRKGIFDDVDTVIDRIIYNISNSNMTPELVKCVYYGIINSIIKTSNDIGIDFLSEEETQCVDQMIITKFETLEDIKNGLKDLCLNICTMIQDKRDNKNENMAMAILNYINEDYSNNSLSLEGIAQRFGISASSCNKIFKSYTGSTIMKFVDELRFEKAKELLKHSNCNLQYILDKNATNFKQILNNEEDYPGVKKIITMPNGKIYSLPYTVDKDFVSLQVYPLIYLNRKWMEKSGEKMPATTDEFYDVLKAFKVGDLNGNGIEDEIPFYPYGVTNVTNLFAGFWGLANRGTRVTGRIDFDEKIGKVRYYPADSMYKEVLQYLNRLHSEGLFADELFNTNLNDLAAKGSKNLIGSFQLGAHTYVGPEHENDFEGLESALEGPYGHKVWSHTLTAVTTIGSFVITSKNKYPNETMKWVDYFYCEEGMKLFFAGKEGVTYRVGNDGKVEMMDIIANNPEGLTYAAALNKYVPFSLGDNPALLSLKYFTGVESLPITVEAATRMKPYALSEVWGPFSYTLEEMEKFSSLNSSINSYVNTMSSDFITGKVPFSEWDNYVSELKKMGLEEYLEIQQTAYERYISN